MLSNSKTFGATAGAGTADSCGALKYAHGFKSGSFCKSCSFCVVFCGQLFLFLSYLVIIMLFVLRFRVSGYPFSVFKRVRLRLRLVVFSATFKRFMDGSQLFPVFAILSLNGFKPFDCAIDYSIHQFWNSRNCILWRQVKWVFLKLFLPFLIILESFMLRPHAPPMLACRHPNAGQELCYLSQQRKQNIPVSFVEDCKRWENISVFFVEDCKRREDIAAAFLEGCKRREDIPVSLVEDRKRREDIASAFLEGRKRRQGIPVSFVEDQKGREDIPVSFVEDRNRW